MATHTALFETGFIKAIGDKPLYVCVIKCTGLGEPLSFAQTVPQTPIGPHDFFNARRFVPEKLIHPCRPFYM